MDIQKVGDFVLKHGAHTITVERTESAGVRVGRMNTFSDSVPKPVQEQWSSPGYVLGVPISHIAALYCCGECCK